MSPELQAGLWIGFAGALVVGGVAWSIRCSVEARREAKATKRVLTGLLDSFGRLATIVGQIEPRVAYDADQIVAKARSNARSGETEPVPASGAGDAPKEGGARRTGPDGKAKARKLPEFTDEQKWAMQCKERGWKDSDWTDLEGEDREDAERLVAEVKVILEGAKAS